MRKKRFLSLFAAVCLTLSIVGCKQNDDVSTGQEQTSAVSNSTILPKVKEEETETETESETTTASQNAEINIETLAEGEERDYNIEDILKNDLEIDGIPISIPCTLNELLETLGDDYSVKESDIKDSFDGEANTKSKYFTGDYVSISLYYKGENTYGFLRAIADPENIDFDTINIIGFRSGLHNGMVNLYDLHIGDNIKKCFEQYGKPNDVYDNGSIYLTYKNSDCIMEFKIDKNVIEKIFIIGFETEDL